ncbi:unnamed protein product [Trifolium pratense]|uniref:Uncharacterized protein n=1 Tax=Trifolium pratense TaxID=57577 RepID=A0ACB0LS87_TRIPR|nr:unnamed protein product [Trifolium pratense]
MFQNNNSVDEFDQDPMSWSMQLENHFCGEFSMASIQSNLKMEDKSQVEVCNYATFVGIYDGNKGDSAARYLNNYIFKDLLDRIEKYLKRYNMTKDAAKEIMLQSFSEMEKQFTEIADFGYTSWKNPYMSVVSSGCLICLIWGRELYLANLGDSRAILCSNQPGSELLVHPMLRDHNCRNVEIPQELESLHGHDDTICSNVFGEWRVKGLSETSRCIGNAYLKKAEFTTESGFKAAPGEEVTSIFTEPVLSAEPELYTRDLDGTEKFIIFGSGGFWKLLTNEEAAKIVNDHPREGIAKRLAAQAVKVAAERWGLAYREVMLAPKGVKISGKPCTSSELIKPLYHDDITVIVVYLDLNLPVTVDSETYNSYRSHSDSVLPSGFGYDVKVDDHWDYGKIGDEYGET